jgi:uncharacterized protein (TIGR00369 family)
MLPDLAVAEPAWSPRNPDFAARVRDNFERQGFMGLVGAALETVQPGRCVLGVDYRPALTQQHGYFHGGLIGTLADMACGYAAFTLADAATSILTVEYKLNLLEPGQGERLVADARVMRGGKRVSVCEAAVWVLDGPRRTRCAVALATLMLLPGRSDHASVTIATGEVTKK